MLLKHRAAERIIYLNMYQIIEQENNYIRVMSMEKICAK